MHTYAFSVAANAILSLFPFIVLLITLCAEGVSLAGYGRQWWADMMRSFLPNSQDFVMRNMQSLVHPRRVRRCFRW